MTASTQDTSVEPPSTPSSLRADEATGEEHHKLHIARATPKDQKALYELELRCFDPGMAFRARQIKDLLRNPRCDVWVLTYPSQIVAQIIVLRKKFRDGIHARIYSLTVDLDSRGRGLSRILLNHALDDLKSRGIQNVYLEVESDATVPLALYATLGFVQHHVLKDYYEIGRHGIKMRKRLYE